MSRAKSLCASTLLCALGLILPQHSVAQVTPAGTLIRNVGNVAFNVSGGARTVDSNEVQLAVVPLPSRATIQLARFEASAPSTFTAGPTQCRLGNAFTALASPAPQGKGTLDPLTPIPMQDTAIAHAGDPVFVRVVDADRNRDGAVVETVDVRIFARATGDSEILRLSETGPNTGVFVGYIATATNGATADCLLQVERNSALDVTYVDPTDDTDAVQAEALVDPFGLVFDSQTGLPVNGARVRLIDNGTGLPAAVFGDDGVSRYPNEMVTGEQVVDQGGTQYSMPAGVFRFPLVAPGTYRVEVLPPGNYTFPSSRTIPDLQTLPGAPYRLQDGSYGRSFVTTAAPAVALDVPLDPSGETLVLRKTAGQQIASTGDFVQYTLTLQNTSQSGAFTNVQVIDRLPAGARYRAGSLRLDGVKIADPVVAADGAGFTYTHPRIEPGVTITLKYVVEYTVAMRGMRDAINTAQAVAPGNVRSNQARSLVRMNDELFSQKGFIVGRVYEGSCDDDGRDAAGVPNVRVYLEDGRYGVTDENGHFHFEGLDPGTHTVQLDKFTLPDWLELAPCADRMNHAGRDFSQFAELRGGTLWRSDFVLRQKVAPKGDVAFEFKSSLLPDPEGEGLAMHEAIVRVGGVSAGNTRAMVMLPAGLEYVSGSATLDGVKVSDAAGQVEGVGGPVVSAGDGTLIARLGELPPGTVRTLRFQTHATPNAGGQLEFRALAMFDSPAKSGLRTEPVTTLLTRGAAKYARSTFTFAPRFDVLKTELLPSDEHALRALIDSWRGARELTIHAVGHADSQPISGRNRQVFKDNYALSEARARAVADYLAAALNVPAARVRVEGHGSDEPLNSGKDAASLAANRRVDIVIEGARFEANAPLELVNAGGAAPKIDTVGVVLRGAAAADAMRNLRKRVATETPSFAASYDVADLQPGIKWLFPEDNSSPPIAATKVFIQHAPDQKAELTLNGQPVDALNYDGLQTNDANTVSLSRWRGVHLRDGDNVFQARIVDADGKVLFEQKRTIHYGDGPVRAEIDPSMSKLVADGRTRPVIALRMFDKYGKPARAGTAVPFSIDAPYRTMWEVEQLNDNQILATGPREPQADVIQGGVALIELEPTTDTGNAIVRLRYDERQSEELKVWLAPAPRDWILVGIAEGTAAYNKITGNMETASAADREEGFEQDGRVAFFAKGRIKGDFLLTMAYDSAREKQDARDRLKGTIEPDRYYLLYGDGTEQRFEAATQNKIYLKIERRQFVALFGDFDTGFTVTELTRYNRSLSGVRSDFAGERVSVSGFAARTDTGLVQDELPGDGTSGLYRLSRTPIVIGSDKVRIEIRDRFDIHKVVESRELARFLDYDLDYERGTVFFKEPVSSRDANLNPVFIVADYEVRTGGDDETATGLRVATKFNDGKIELGASAVSEGAQQGDTRIVGSDLTWRVSDETRVRAEVAQSSSDDPLKPDSSTAWLVEGKHASDRFEARAWARETETGFGVGQQLTADTGTRSGGVDARYRLGKEIVVTGEVQHDTVLASEATRLLTSVDAQLQRDDYTVGGGLRHVADKDADGDDRVSDQAFVTGSIDLWDDRVTLRGASDFSLGGNDASVDYPARSLVGVDYRLNGESTLYAEYEHAEGAELETNITRVGMRTRPWDRTQVNSSINTQATEFGPRTFANFGLTQGFMYKEKWLFDMGVDQTNTLRGPNLEPLNPNAPLASGTMTDDFFAAFAGASYRQEAWQFTSRLEHRNSDREERWSSTTGWYREPVAGHALSVSLQAFDSDQAQADETSAVGRVAWAYRPDSSRWIVFDRFELKYEDHGGGVDAFSSSRAVNNLHANWQLDPKLQLGLQYGVRYVASTFDGDEYAGVSDIAGFDLRRQLTRRFDLGVHAALLHSWESNVMDHSTGIDVGMTIMKNMWVSVGYNFAGFRDDDFSASRHTAQGPYLKIRIKADQDTFKDLSLDSLRPSR
ncbi:MAG TPA: OmpA family protein [Steroidobacteraceae bacterium]|nr:OmpA family protein [Steroidobacteraceae bacterium]